MAVRKKTIMLISFLAGFFITILAFYFKVVHSPLFPTSLMASMMAYFLFIILAIFEVLESNRIGVAEKLMWILGLLFMVTVVGFIYLNSGRKRILNLQNNSTNA